MLTASCLVLGSLARSREEGPAPELERRAAEAAARGDLQEAAGLWRDAATAFEDDDDDAGLLRALVRLGETERDIGRPREAAETLSQAVALAAKELGAAELAAARGALGSALLAAGDLAGARTELEHAEVGAGDLRPRFEPRYCSTPSTRSAALAAEEPALPPPALLVALPVDQQLALGGVRRDGSPSFSRTR